jgi:hypothetical protein
MSTSGSRPIKTNSRNLFSDRSVCTHCFHSYISSEMGIKDPALLDILESALGWNTLQNFVCQTQADYAKFSDIFHEHKYAEYDAPEGGAGVNCLANPGKTVDDFRPSMSREDLAALGFDGLVSDLFEASPIVTVAILNKSHAHRTV